MQNNRLSRFSLFFIAAACALTFSSNLHAQAASDAQLSFDDWITEARHNAHNQPGLTRQQALEFIAELKKTRSVDLYRAFIVVADSYAAEGQFEQSRDYLKKALPETVRLREHGREVDVLFQVGLTYLDQFDYVNTYRYFAMAMRRAKQHGLPCREFELKVEVGSLLTELADYSHAQEVMESAPMDAGCPTSVYQSVMGRLLSEQGKYEEAATQYEAFFKTAKGQQSLAYITDIKADYVPFLVDAGELDRAEELLKDISSAMEEKGIRNPVGTYEWAFARVLEAKGEFEQALKYAEIVLADDLELPASVRMQVDHEVLPTMVKLYTAVGDQDKTQTMMSRLLDNNSMFFSRNRSALLGIAEARLNVAERDGEISFLSQQATVNQLERERLMLIITVIGILALGSAIWGVSVYRRNRVRQQLYQALEVRNEKLSARVEGAETELAQKETLFHEAHHRLKNNLHFLVSLLEIQRSRLDESAASKISNVLLDAANRVQAMAVIHQFAYGEDGDKPASIKDLLQNLVEQTADIGEGAIQIEVQADELELDDEVAKSLVLIVNELICNAQKHAFDKKGGKINVSLKHTNDGDYKLTVSDNGKGFAEPIEDKTRKSMGLRLVRSMVKQMDGVLNVNSGKFGTYWTVEF
ncbi:MAG: sensor histidine kinase [Acidiferrobacterales bacterium]|nr:sensor histidine kinase [Acidiferrobacterales bacterium]